MNHATKRGYQAYWNGQHKNPYTPGEMVYKDWQRGHLVAKRKHNLALVQAKARQERLDKAAAQKRHDQYIEEAIF